MVYTCFQMVRDCRADLPEGWRYFAAQYVPVMRRLLLHYAGDDSRLDAILLDQRRPESSLFQTLDPAPERWLIAELRQRVLAALPSPSPEISLDLETVAAALAPLTMTEKQAVWFEAMRYDAETTGAMMRVAPATVEKIRARAAELIRGSVDSWRRNLLVENAPSLFHEALAASGPDCLPVKAFLDILDGRTTWREREMMEQHVNSCWHCVDHYARMVEVVGVMRGSRALTDAEAAPYYKLLGAAASRRPAWKRLLGA